MIVVLEFVIHRQHGECNKHLELVLLLILLKIFIMLIVFIVIGANPTNAHPVTGAKIKQQVMKGKKLIVLDPITTELS